MRPIKLELSGLNSYIEKVSIDFEELTNRGLFGIFGNTGSGKSTILDAITIAMYGNISRNTNEFINSSCDKAIISYEFEIGSKNAKRRYIVDRTIVRSNTGIKTSYARCVNFKLFRRIKVRRDDRKFAATKMESFYDAIIFRIDVFMCQPQNDNGDSVFHRVRM